MRNQNRPSVNKPVGGRHGIKSPILGRPHRKYPISHGSGWYGNNTDSWWYPGTSFWYPGTSTTIVETKYRQNPIMLAIIFISIIIILYILIKQLIIANTISQI
jgi:hypothetical protein